MHSSTLDTPSIAVCLAAFNGVRYLQQQVDSIFSQSESNITLYVSVDLSSDGTEAWCSSLQAKEARVVVLPLGEKFGGAARNFFRLLRDVDFSASDYIAFADQDDIWLPGKLKRATDVLTENGVDGYSSDVVAFWDSGKSRYIKKSFSQKRWDYLFESAGPGCTFVISRKLALHIQAVLRERQQASSEIGLHDWFTYAFARANGYQWVIDEHASLMYRQHDENQVGVNAGFSAFAWRTRQVLNGWGLSQARLISQVIGLDDQPFVRRWSRGSRLGLMALALQARQCRRRPRDQFLFALSCLALTVWGWK